MQTINERVFFLRKSIYLNQKKFSEILGVPRSSLSEIENGKRSPNVDLIVRISNNFKEINTDWLLTGKGEMYRQAESQPVELQESYSAGIVTPSAILNRMNLILGEQGDASIAQGIGEPIETIKQWRKKGQVPYETCEQFADQHKISLKWIITGFGDMNSTDTMDRRMYIMNQLMESLPAQEQKEILADIKNKKRINAIEQELAALKAR